LQACKRIFPWQPSHLPLVSSREPFTTLTFATCHLRRAVYSFNFDRD
jgi:hypothetical protein